MTITLILLGSSGASCVKGLCKQPRGITTGLCGRGYMDILPVRHNMPVRHAASASITEKPVEESVGSEASPPVGRRAMPPYCQLPTGVILYQSGGINGWP